METVAIKKYVELGKLTTALYQQVMHHQTSVLNECVKRNTQRASGYDHREDILEVREESDMAAIDPHRDSAWAIRKDAIITSHTCRS